MYVVCVLCINVCVNVCGVCAEYKCVCDVCIVYKCVWCMYCVQVCVKVCILCISVCLGVSLLHEGRESQDMKRICSSVQEP